MNLRLGHTQKWMLHSVKLERTEKVVENMEMVGRNTFVHGAVAMEMEFLNDTVLEEGTMAASGVLFLMKEH